MKVYFGWNQLKVDYSIWNEKNGGHGFVCLLARYISVKNNFEKCKSVGSEADKVEKAVGFRSNADLNFTDIRRV